MEEEILTIEEDAIFSGVSSVNGLTGDVPLKTINGEEVTGEGNIEIAGSGTVKSVNEVEPDEDGNITLTASDVGAQTPLTAGENITIEDGVISASGESYTAGNNITIADGVISATDTTYTAGTNVNISNENVISATDTTYTAGNGLDLTGTEFSADTTVLATKNDLSGKQNTLTAGSNITISNDTISATDTTYTAGTGINITSGAISVDTTTIQPKLTAGSNITINGDEISATDTTYSNFTGTDGTAAGAAGLVPAPATTDAGKFLKADGTWDTAGSSGPTVVQTTGTSQTDVMSQDATTKMVYADGASETKIRIGMGASTSGYNALAIGKNTKADYTEGVAIGNAAKANASSSSIAMGASAETTGSGGISLGALSTAKNGYSVAIGYAASANSAGEVNIGSVNETGHGYNSSNYRLLSGVYDGQSAHDAATKGQLDARVIQNAGAPTTSTVGTVGQLLEDTTNGKLYQCTAVDNTDPQNIVYTWTEVGAGGGGGGVTTLSTSDYNYPTEDPNCIALWLLPEGFYNIPSGVAWRYQTLYGALDYAANVILGEVKWDTRSMIVVGRGGVLLACKLTSQGVLAYTSAESFAPMCKGEISETLTQNGGTSAPSSSTKGSVGSLYSCVNSGTAELYMCTAVSGSTYTWTKIY